MPRQKFDVVILVKHGLYPEFINLVREGQGTTWLSEIKPSNVKIIHYYGVPGGKWIQFLDRFHEKLRWQSRTSHYLVRFAMQLVSLPFLWKIPKTSQAHHLGLHDDEIQCHVIDTLFTLRWKQLAIYNFVSANYDFKYIYDTNASSYVDVTNLLSQIARFSNSPLYAGNVPLQGFISGANRFFDDLSIRLILKNKANWNPALLEDVALGKLMKSLGVKMTELDSVVVSTVEEANALEEAIFEKNFHFRTKSRLGSQRSDALLMRIIHDRFKQRRGS
jgi:hypothetical protein